MSEFSSSLVARTQAALHRLQVARPDLTYKIGECLQALETNDIEFPIIPRLAQFYSAIASRPAYQALAIELEMILGGWILARTAKPGVSQRLISVGLAYSQGQDQSNQA